MSLYTSEPGGGAVKAPAASATVILLRENAGTPEVFLMRRSRRQSFMGGAYVYPGGKLEPEDCAPDWESRAVGCGGDLARRLHEPALDPATARGLYCCAIREMFEEAGVLLAADEAGRPLDVGAAENSARLADLRARLNRGELDFGELINQLGLRLDFGLLLPYAHWITPEAEPVRFDTRFFLARLPEGQTAVHDCSELVDSQWLSPAGALARQREGKLMLIPPTLKTLEELSGYHTLAELLAAARDKEIPTIMPEAYATPDGFGVRLPSDPEYANPAFKLPPIPHETSRFLLRNGKWEPRKPGEGTRA